MISELYIGTRVKYPLFLSHFNETEFSGQIFEQYSNMKFRENPFSGNRRPRGRRDGQARHDEAIVAVSNFANAPKIAALQCNVSDCILPIAIGDGRAGTAWERSA
jgi:hypothetical protein